MQRQWLANFLITFFFANQCSQALAANPDIEAFKQSWTAKALKWQREIDLNTPLNEATFIGTHNSYNALSYRIPFVRYIDPNQLLSIYDQLEMGVRSIELDAHWTYNSHLSKAILLCHSLPQHLSCSLYDRDFSQGLQEIHDWLKANPHEVVLLYIERHLDGHEPRLAAMLEQSLGDFIFKPSLVRKAGENSKACVALPGSLTKAAVLQAGKQLLIVTKDCDGSEPHYEEQDQFKQTWNDYVFAGTGPVPSQPFDILDTVVADFTPFPDCGKSTIFQPDVNHVSLWRIFEDRTLISRIFQPSKYLQAADMTALMQCGINWPTMDMLSVDDDRLKAAVWSWAPTYPQPGRGQCTLYKNGQGMQNTACEDTLPGFACLEKTTHSMKAIAASGRFENGESLCQTLAGKNWHFAVPVNGYQMALLKLSMADLPAVWLNDKEAAASSARES